MDSATILTDRFDRALLYAIHVHGGQVREGTSTPYVAHLLAVSATILENGGDEDLAVVALLHDSVEDQGGKGRPKGIRNRFGDRVARVLAACSDSLANTAKGERKADWEKRKEAYLAHPERQIDATDMRKLLGMTSPSQSTALALHQRLDDPTTARSRAVFAGRSGKRAAAGGRTVASPANTRCDDAFPSSGMGSWPTCGKS